MKKDVGHSCGHVVEWEADTTSEIAFGMLCADQAGMACPFCEQSSEPWRREIRFGSAVLPELVARRETEYSRIGDRA